MIPITLTTTLEPSAFTGVLRVRASLAFGGEVLHSEKLVPRGFSVDALGYLMDSQKRELREAVAKFFEAQEVPS